MKRILSVEPLPEYKLKLRYDDEAVCDIATLRVTQGHLSNRARSLVLDWAAQHRDELFAAWGRLRAGRNPGKIAPLE